MQTLFALAVQFLDPVPMFHGRGDGGVPEWPPSPFRLFQALVAAAARRDPSLADEERRALEWLELQPPPRIVVPAAVTGTPVRIAVPNNDLDTLAKSWARGQEARKQPSELRTLKTIRPTYLRSGDTIFFEWSGDDSTDSEHRETLAGIAARVASLGWGVDLVSARVQRGSAARNERQEEWLPLGDNGRRLRVPTAGSVNELVQRHRQFTTRVGDDGFSPPGAPSQFRAVAYRRAGAPVAQPCAAFALLAPDSGRTVSFDAARRNLTTAGMVRHAVARAARASGWIESRVNETILGHAEAAGEKHRPVAGVRFAYLPIPTLARHSSGDRSVGRIRRVLVTSFSESAAEELQWVQRALPGAGLQSEAGRLEALLSPIAEVDTGVAPYRQSAAAWTSVTPVILPGFDDPAHYRRRIAAGVSAEEQRRLFSKLGSRIELLLRKAIAQAGIPSTLAEQAEIEWRRSGFLAGVESVSAYGVPDHLRAFSRVHVRITWKTADGSPMRIPGPICIGAGRFYGLGLLVGDE